LQATGFRKIANPCRLGRTDHDSSHRVEQFSPSDLEGTHQVLSKSDQISHEVSFNSIPASASGWSEFDLGADAIGPYGFEGTWRVKWSDTSGRDWTKRSDGELTSQSRVDDGGDRLLQH
jgi:hypothetical protein